MSTVFIIFPHQLFADTSVIKEVNPDRIVMVEHPVFFGWRPIKANDTDVPASPLNYNKLKLVLHKASMRYHRDYVAGLKIVGPRQIDYVPIEAYMKAFSTGAEMPLSALLRRLHASRVVYWDTVDYFLETRLEAMWKRLGIAHKVIDTPNFINSTADNDEFIRFKGKRDWYHATFYGWQRRHHNVLMTADGKFKGGKLSFDMENRKALPASVAVPALPSLRQQQRYIKAAAVLVEQSFPDNLGNTRNTCHLLCTHAAAEAALRDFIKNRLEHFGDYEDAMNTEHRFVFHSVLSAAINIGLLDPLHVVREVEAALTERPSVGIHNVEGFIRQVLGWREFTRLLYRAEYKAMKTTNAFRFRGRLTPAWYEATTGLRPVDDTIRQAMDWGYLHHIQRLMVMGNIMSLVQMDPDEVYRWFMEFSIDSYDWVMISNVYGMASHSDEGITTTKPYVSSSNYLLNMSNWRADGKWDVAWRQLYYNFIATLKLPNGEPYFRGNPRTGLAWRNWERIGAAEQAHIQADAQRLIKGLTANAS